MKLKPQPRPQRRALSRQTQRPRGRGATRPRGRGARRPGVPLRQRLAGWLPSLRRVLAVLGAASAAVLLIAALNGPWLRVTDVAWAGHHFTDGSDLARVLEGQRGASVLAVDTRALRERIERLPAVAEVTVSASLPGRLSATVVEREAAFVWNTSAARLLGSADGMLFAAVPTEGPLPAGAEALPRIDDDRAMARLMRPGDRIPEGLLRTALRLGELDPAALGSAARSITVHLDDEFGFGIVSDEPGWRIAFGAYGADPGDTAADAAARVDDQVAAVRTLFATRSEAEIGWVDARNPGKVYFRAKG